MILTILGSGSCELRVDRSSPAYHLAAGDTRLLLDLGQGAWRRLSQAGHEPTELTGIVLSHHHLDHMADLLPLLFALRYDPALNQGPGLGLWAHDGLGAVLAGLTQVFGHWVESPLLAYHPLSPGDSAQAGQVRLSTSPVRHIATSLGWRLEHQGASLVYLGDSAFCPEAVALAQGADLLLAHCAANDGDNSPNHLSPSDSGRLAAQAGVGALLLSHFYRAVAPQRARDLAAAQFDGPVLAAQDLMRLEVTPGVVRVLETGL